MAGASMGMHLNLFGPPSSLSLVRYCNQTLFDLYKGKWRKAPLISGTRDELLHDFPKMVPFFKELGVDVILYVAYTVSPRHTDEYYAEYILPQNRWRHSNTHPDMTTPASQATGHKGAIPAQSAFPQWTGLPVPPMQTHHNLFSI
jgi:hypothetical protein